MSGINHRLANWEATLIRTGPTGFQVQMKMAELQDGNQCWAVCRNMPNTSIYLSYDVNFSCTATLLHTVWAWQRGLWKNVQSFENWRRQWKNCDKQRSGFCLFTTSVVELKLLQMFTISYVNWQLSASCLELLSLQQLVKSGRDYVVVLTSAVLLLFCHKSHLRRFEVILTCCFKKNEPSCQLLIKL